MILIQNSSIFVLDASAFLSIQQIFSIYDHLDDMGKKPTLLTNPEILGELRDEFSKLRIESMRSSNDLLVRTAKPSSFEQVKEKCYEIGNLHRLSPQDISIVALAWEVQQETQSQEIVLYSDDYEIQNTAYHLNIPFKEIRMKKISYSVKYIKFCASCNSITKSSIESCTECGSQKFRYKKVKQKILKQQSNL